MLWQEWSQQGLNAMGKLVADIIVETLQNAGVKHCYGVVGDTLNLIARSLDKSEIEWVSVRHEEAGAFATQSGSAGSLHRRANRSLASRSGRLSSAINLRIVP
jgi:Thiamine pyrophosphate enzyme, N-terminal TPP binding domain